MFFKLLKDAFKVKQVRSEDFIYDFYHSCFPHWNHDYGARCKCENSEQPSRCVLLEHAQFSFWEML